MIRSRSIPTVLSRATGEGIHAVLLIDADGELLGSYGSPPPPPAPHEPDTGAGTPTPSTPTTIPSSSNGSMNNSPSDWPLDAASIGALISEVAGDYRRLGEELVLLDPASRRRNDKDDGSRQQDNLMVGESGSSGDDAGKEGGVSSSGKGEKKGSLDSGVNIKSLVIELEHGVVGVASAGLGYYVIALADTTVQHGALSGRLRSLGSYVREAMSQLD